jgi:CdiI immunity protein
MTDEHPKEQKPFDPADFPALREFFPAYLHQDFAVEYGSAVGAVRSFLADASGDEILQVKEEWKMFRAAFWRCTFEEIRAALDKLGSAWSPENERELQRVDEILSHAEA